MAFERVKIEGGGSGFCVGLRIRAFYWEQRKAPVLGLRDLEVAEDGHHGVVVLRWWLELPLHLD